jgi:hypothetical protein
MSEKSTACSRWYEKRNSFSASSTQGGVAMWTTQVYRRKLQLQAKLETS